MNFERYLESVTRTLRDDVLPTMPPSPARDQVVNCIRVLTRTTIGMQASPQDAATAFDDLRLPNAVRESFRAPSVAALIPPALAEEISVDASTLPGMKTASEWLETEPWCNNATLRQEAIALLAHESKWRNARLARMTAAEKEGGPARPAILSGAKMTEASLLAYLRTKLNNPDFQILDCKPLPGGRTRKTLKFRQTGQTDWPQSLVVQCDPPPGYHSFPGVTSQFPVLEYVQQLKGLRVPRPLWIELDPEPFGTPFMIVEGMPGSPPTQGIDFFAPPPPSEKLALSMAEQLGLLHSLSPEPMMNRIPVLLPGEGGWPSDLDHLVSTIKQRTHGPSLTLSAAFSWMRANVHRVNDTRTLVHGDYLLHNLLTENELVSGILDWEGVRVGHPGEDLGYVRPVIEKMTTWDKFMEVYRANGGPEFSAAEADYFALRAYILMLTHIAGSRNAFEEGKVDDIRAAEVGCSLGPLFVNCVGETLEKVLQRESK